ncbi:MAG: GAF domain-containing sensor histidine kinase [Solirubrobacterales bacterium]
MPDRLDERRLRQLIAAGRHLLSSLELDAVLEALLEDAREITGAKYAAIGVLDDEGRALERFVAVGVDEETRRRIGHPPRGRGVLGELIRNPTPLRLDDVSSHPASIGLPPGHPPMHTFLGTPVPARGEPFGNLYLAEKRDGKFDEADQEAVEVLADWASVAVANAQSVEADRLRERIRSAERERGHWARELHDETLQGLGALQVILSAAARAPESQAVAEACNRALDLVREETEKLRSLISELRPAALDEIGLEAALRGLLRRSASRSGLSVDSAIELPADGDEILNPERETAIYRVVQEALTNVERHSAADRVVVEVVCGADAIRLSVVDDGKGFDPGAHHQGFGLRGIRERIDAVGGSCTIETTLGGGAAVSATMPRVAEADGEFDLPGA